MTGSKPPPNRPTNEELSQMYPVPKTYEQHRQDDLERQKRFEERRPQHVALTLGGWMTVLLWASLFLLSHLGSFWLSSPLIGVSLSLTAALIIIGAGGLVWRYMVHAYESYDRPLASLYVPYFIVFAGVCTAYFWLDTATSQRAGAWLLLGAGLHFGICFFLVRRSLH